MVPANRFFELGIASAPSFFEGNWAYNFVSLAVAIVGFGLTLWQLYKTRRAADAARESAQRTADGFHDLKALTDFSQLGRLAEGIISYIDNKDFRSAKVRLLDVRHGLARAHESAGPKGLQTESQWQEIIKAVAWVDERVAALAEMKKPGAEYVLECRAVMLTVSESLVKLAERAEMGVEPKLENRNADS